EPVADLGLPAVVDLDDVDGQVPGVDRGDVLLDVGRGDVGEVVVPRAPAGRCRPDGAHADRRRVPVGPRGQPFLDRGGRRGADRPVRADDQVAVDECGAHRRYRRAGRSPEDGDRVARAGVDGEQALTLEPAVRRGPAGTVALVLGDRPDRPVAGRDVGRVAARRAPALPAVLVDARGTTVD